MDFSASTSFLHIHWSALNLPMVLSGVALLTLAALVWYEAAGSHERLILPGTMALAGAGSVAFATLGYLYRPDWPGMDDCLALLAVAQDDRAGAAAAEEALPGTLGFVTGPRQGQVYRLGDDITRHVVPKVTSTGLQDDLVVTNISTRGSRDNLARLLRRVNAGIGIMHSDVIATLSAKEKADNEGARLRLLQVLHAEPLQLLARTSVRTIADLQGKRVLVVNDTDSAKPTGDHVFKRLKVFPKGGSLQAETAERAVCQVVTGSADAVLVVAAKPAPVLSRLERLGGAWAGGLAQLHFVPIPADQSPDREAGIHEPATLGPDDYPWLPADSSTSTQAVRVMLVAFDFASAANPTAQAKCKQIGRLVCQLRQEHPRLRNPPFSGLWRDMPDLQAPAGRQPAGPWLPHQCVPATC